MQLLYVYACKWLQEGVKVYQQESHLHEQSHTLLPACFFSMKRKIKIHLFYLIICVAIKQSMCLTVCARCPSPLPLATHGTFTWRYVGRCILPGRAWVTDGLWLQAGGCGDRGSPTRWFYQDEAPVECSRVNTVSRKMDSTPLIPPGS